MYTDSEILRRGSINAVHLLRLSLGGTDKLTDPRPSQHACGFHPCVLQNAALLKEFRTIYSHLKPHCLCVAKDESQCESWQSALCLVWNCSPQGKGTRRALTSFSTQHATISYEAFQDISLDGVIPGNHTLRSSHWRSLRKTAGTAVKSWLWRAGKPPDTIGRVMDGRQLALQSFVDNE